MRAYTLNELMSLTRAELCALHRRIVDALAQLPEASPERLIALANLRAIRSVLARPNLSPMLRR
jgi:UDP-3-O-[3-hydroxymyristoyl] glucosamine N-acyltransferase